MEKKIDPYIHYPVLSSQSLLFESDIHKKGWNYLVSGVVTREPVLLMVGASGLGKTTLCIKLCRFFGTKIKLPFVTISGHNHSYIDILKNIAQILSITIDSDHENDLIQAIYAHFRKQKTKKGIFILIDDAHSLDEKDLFKLLNLIKFKVSDFSPVRFILFANENIVPTIEQPEFKSLSKNPQRVFFLSPLEFTEVCDFTKYMLERTKRESIPEVTDDAFQELFLLSKGFPKSVNFILQSVLFTCFLENKNKISSALIKEAFLTVAEKINVYKEKSSLEPTAVPLVWRDTEAAQTLPTPSTNSDPTVSKGFALSWLWPAFSLSALIIALISFVINSPSPRIEMAAQPKLSTSGIKIEKKVSFAPQVTPIDKKEPVDRPKELNKEQGQVTSIKINQGVSKEIPHEVAQTQSQPMTALEQAQSQTDVETSQKGLDENPQSKLDSSLESKPVTEPGTKPDTTLATKPEVKATGVTNAQDIVIFPPPLPQPYILLLDTVKKEKDARIILKRIKKKNGIEPILVKVNLGRQGIYWRIFYGHFESKTEAQQAKKVKGLKSAKVKKTDYTVKIATLEKEDTNHDQYQQLEQKGYSPYFLTSYDQKARLLVGAFITQKGAKEYQKWLKKDGFSGTVEER